ncbi:MAG: hypothetical protein E7609_06195 [Ruminococcaceae bacterium]|nr:hypothetical protein [Oscillospiraceae bacterium]
MLLESVLAHLPMALKEEILRRLATPPLHGARISEIRLRRGRIASLSLFRDGRLINLPLSFVADGAALDETLAHATGGSVYAFEEQLKEGYFSLPQGVRVGASGRAVSKDGVILSLSSIDSIVFRLPGVTVSGDALFSFYQESAGGILLFAPPGGGKTTLLRAFSARAARERRVAVIDTREEFFFAEKSLLIDHLTGYPKAKGAEIAVRTLSPDLLVLDEIGASEAAALVSLVTFGVRTVASVHGDEAATVLRAPALFALLRSGLFSHLWDVRKMRATPIGEL